MLARLMAAEHYDIRVAYLLLLPSVLYLLAMSVYPMFFSLWLAFRNYLIYRPDLSSFAGMGNFVDLSHNEVFWQSLQVTLKFSAIAVTMEFILGIAVLWIALMSPLDELGDEYLFSAHMTQHMILEFIGPVMLIAARAFDCAGSPGPI